MSRVWAAILVAARDTNGVQELQEQTKRRSVICNGNTGIRSREIGLHK